MKAADGYTYYMACTCIDTILGKVVEEDKRHTKFWKLMKARDLEYKEYEPLYELCYMTAQKAEQEGILCYM